MVTIVTLPPHFYAIVIAATAVIALYLFWKPLLGALIERGLTASRPVRILLNISVVGGFILDISFASALTLFPWMVFTYLFSAPLVLMREYTSKVENHVALSSVLIGVSVAFLGIIVAAVSVLSSREESRRSMPRFFFWAKWMTRFSLASITLAFGSLLARTTDPFVFGELPPFLLALSALCFLPQVYLTLPAMRFLTERPLELQESRPSPQKPSRRTLAGAAVSTLGLTFMVLGMLLILGLL